MIPISAFSKKVIRFIHQIPRGKVATYGQIAALSDKPHGARGVAWILHSCSTVHQLPWHRVLSSRGRICFDRDSSNFGIQRRKLIEEGVDISSNGQLDLAKFQWKKKKLKQRQASLSPQIFRPK